MQQKQRSGVLTQPAISRGANGSVEVNPLVMAGTAAAAIIIPAILFLAFRSASRVERRDEFVAALTKHINKHPLVRMHVGSLFATHAPFEVSPTAAQGYMRLMNAGEVKAVAIFEASRKSKKADWTYDVLKLEVDKGALDAFRAEQEEKAVARYGAEAVAAGKKSAEAHLAAAAAAAGYTADQAKVAASSAPAAAAAGASAAAGSPAAAAQAGGAAEVPAATVDAKAKEGEGDDEGQVLVLNLSSVAKELR